MLHKLLNLAAFVVAVRSLPFKKDFCMSDPFPCQTNETADVYGEFSDVHSQLGCAERCAQYDVCYK